MRNIFGILSQACKNSPFLSLFVAFLLYVLFSMVLVPALFGLSAVFSGVGWNELLSWVQGDFEQEQERNTVRFIQGASQLLTWGLAAVVTADLMGNPMKTLRLKVLIQPLFLLLAPIIVILSIPSVQRLTFDETSFQLGPFAAAFEAWVHESEARSEFLLKELLYTPTFPIYLFNLVVFAVIPAFTEEFFFRGVIQKSLYRIVNIHAAIWITAFVFSVIHFQFYGILSRWFLGVILGYLVYGAGSLVPAILGHFVFNAVSVSAMYQAGVFELDPNSLWEGQGSVFSGNIVLISVLGLVALFIGYFRVAKIHKSLDV